VTVPRLRPALLCAALLFSCASAAGSATSSRSETFADFVTNLPKEFNSSLSLGKKYCEIVDSTFGSRSTASPYEYLSTSEFISNENKLKTIEDINYKLNESLPSRVTSNIGWGMGIIEGFLSSIWVDENELQADGSYPWIVATVIPVEPEQTAVCLTYLLGHQK